MTLPPAEGGPFASDHLLGEEIQRLIVRYGIQSAVETGVYQGVTTRALAEMVPAVYAIESDDARFTESRERLADLPDVRIYHGGSQDILPEIIPQITKPALYYLDAHIDGSAEDGHQPLPREAEIIAQLDPSPIMVMHDMFVPDHPEFHANLQTPGGIPYDYEWVSPGLEKIREPWRHYYNSEAEGLKVGIMFVVPDKEIAE